MGQVIFITATDTGAGKTLLTSLLLTHLRQSGCHALATKPFCSGSRADIQILARAQNHEIGPEQITPFYLPQPVAPLVGVRKARLHIPITRVRAHIQTLAANCELLLVEGAGGLFVPLGEHYTVADIIQSLGCPVLVAARNKLGVVNHALLTLAALGRLGIPGAKLVLMNEPTPTLATKTNGSLIAEWTSADTVAELPYLGKRPVAKRALIGHAKNFHKTLAELLRIDTFCLAFRESGSGKNGRKSKSFRLH